MLIVVFCYKAHLSHSLTLTNIIASGSSILLVITTVKYCEILAEKVEMRLLPVCQFNCLSLYFYHVSFKL